MIAEQDVPPLRRVHPSLPRDLETVIAKAMSKFRDQRYETAAEFAEDLRHVLSGDPTVARPPTIIDHVSRYAAKHRVAVLASVAVGLLALSGFAVSTALITSGKRVSDAHAARAARNEQLARRAVDRLGSQMAELLAAIPAADQVRRTLLAETLQYYQTLAANADDDPDLREDLAITLGKIGAIHGELGESNRAIEALARSEAIYAELAALNADWKLDWATSQNNLAQSLAAAGRLERAAEYFAKALTTQRQLAAAFDLTGYTSGHDDNIVSPDARALKLGTATTLNNLGLLLAESLAIEEAEKQYLVAIDILRSGDFEPTDERCREQLASVLCNLSALLATRSPHRAIEFAKQALDLQATTLAKDRRDTKLATQTIVTLNTLGASQTAAAQPAAAIRTFEQAVDISQQRLARWPDHAAYQRDLVISLNHLGLAYSKVGKLQEASCHFQHALTYGRPLAQSFVNDAETQSMLGGVLNNLGFLQQQLGDSRAAAANYRQAIQAQSIAVKLAPQVQRYREYLRKHKNNSRDVSSEPLLLEASAS